MRRAYLALAFLLAVGFAATGTAVAETVASVSAEGACYDDGGSGAEDTTAATVTRDDVQVDETDAASLAEALEACATNGDLPGGGSYLAADAAVVDGLVAASGNTVPASDLATGQEDEATTSAKGEGACWDKRGHESAFGEGGEDSGSASLTLAPSDEELVQPDVDTPEKENVDEAVEACTSYVGTPGPGSYLATEVSVANGGITVSFTTVPASDLIT